MSVRAQFLVIGLILTVSTGSAEEKRRVKPNINQSKEFPGVFHSPSADATPTVFRSILQLELVTKRGDEQAKVQYANGTVLTKDGLVVSVLDQPRQADESVTVESATVLLLDGGGANAEVVAIDPTHGVAIFRVKELAVRPLALSKTSLVANRRLSWHTVFKQGRKTFLYTRPLRVHKPQHAVEGASDLCEIIDTGTSSLNADRSGSPLVALDGSVVGLMGRQPHWNVTPKNQTPRLKTAWAVPASVIAELLEDAKNGG